MNSCRASYNCGGQVAFVFRLPAGQVEFSGLFLTLSSVVTLPTCVTSRPDIKLKYILKDFKNAPPALMLIYVENWIFSLCEK